MSTSVRIAVPPGVGDVYWVLTKLQALRAARSWDHVTLCVQATRYTRALEWAQMVDFVDAAEEYAFTPSAAARSHGYSWQRLPQRHNVPPPDCILWPNAVVDRGAPLATWLPELEIDLSFPIRTAPAAAGRVVVYVSSEAVNGSWLPALGPTYWSELIERIAERTGLVPTLIGADWDASFRSQLSVEVEDLIGKTSLSEVAGILESASVVVGVISGMTILANHFRTPTVALCPDKFPASFARSWVADDAPYAPIRASDMPTAEVLAGIVSAQRVAGRAEAI